MPYSPERLRDVDPAQGRDLRPVGRAGDRAVGDLEAGLRRLDGEREGRLDHDVPLAPVEAHPAVETRQAGIQRQVLLEGRIPEARLDADDGAHRALLDELQSRPALSGPSGDAFEAQLPRRHLLGLIRDRLEDVPGSGQDLAPGRLVVEALDPAGFRVETDLEEVVLELARGGPNASGPLHPASAWDEAIELIAKRRHIRRHEDDAEERVIALGALFQHLDRDVSAFAVGHSQRARPRLGGLRVRRNDDVGERRLRPFPEERIVDDDGEALAARVDGVGDRLEGEVERPLAARPRLAVETGDLVINGADARAVEDIVELVAEDDLPGLVDIAFRVIIPVA